MAKIDLFDFDLFDFDFNTPEMLEFLESIKYLGFDVITIQKEILNSDGFCKQDIFEMVYLYLTRGTNIPRIKTILTADGADRLSTFEKRYNLVSRVRHLNNTAVNLARVGSCFPEVTVCLLSKEEIAEKRPVSGSTMDSTAGRSFPRILMSHVSASILPMDSAILSERDRNAIVVLISLYCCLETRKLNKSKAGLSLKDLFLHCTTYIKAAMDSPLLNTESRLQVCKKYMRDVFNVNDDTLEIKETVLALAIEGCTSETLQRMYKIYKLFRGLPYKVSRKLNHNIKILNVDLLT